MLANAIAMTAANAKPSFLIGGEKRMLSRARQILISELTFAFDQPEVEVEGMLDRVLEEAH